MNDEEMLLREYLRQPSQWRLRDNFAKWAKSFYLKLMAIEYVIGTSLLLLALLNLYTILGAILFLGFVVVLFYAVDTSLKYSYLLVRDYDYALFTKYLRQEPAQHAIFLDWMERNKE